jgi:hypothetical protein
MITLQLWEKNGWVRRHQTSPQEIATTNQDAQELLAFAVELRANVLDWLSLNRPDLVPKIKP